MNLYSAKILYNLQCAQCANNLLQLLDRASTDAVILWQDGRRSIKMRQASITSLRWGYSAVKEFRRYV